MTKAELIRKVAKRAGIPDQEAKFFFELFLKKASLQLRPGETIKLKGLGYFQLKTGRIKKTGTTGEGEIYSDFMVFYSLHQDVPEGSENLIFNIPVLEEARYNFIDSFFSLSFGKPVIPLKNASSSEYFIPPTGVELRRLAELKSEKLLQEVEVVDRYFKGSENLIFNQEEEINTSQIEMDYNQPVETKDDIKNILSWNFGSDLDKEIEEESILDTGAEDHSDVAWDFGEHLSKETPEEKSTPPKDEYQQVKSITSELNIPNMDSVWDFSGEEILKESITEEFSDTKYPFATDISQYTDEEKEIIKENVFPVDEEFPLIEENTVVEDEEPDKPVDLRAENPSDDEVSYIEEHLSVGKKKGLGVFVLLSILVILTAAVLFYFKILSPKIGAPKIKYIASKTIPPGAIIERKYDIPVTYPYDNNTKLSEFTEPYNIAAPPSPSGTVENNEGTINSGTEKEQNTSSTDISSSQQNQNTSGTSEKVKEFIYKKGDKYLVQVSSWQSKRIAEKHAASLQEKGLATEIERVNLDGEVWYRVRVGYFNSIEEAENYSKTNR